MFGWFKGKPKPPNAGDGFAQQLPGEVFPWPKGVVLAALDEVVLALPAALFDPDRPLSEFVFGPDDMGFIMRPNREVCFLKLQPGMSVSLAKSCQAYVVADDERPRRFEVSHVGVRV